MSKSNNFLQLPADLNERSLSNIFHINSGDRQP